MRRRTGRCSCGGLKRPGEQANEFTQPPPPKVKIDQKYTNPETSGLTVQIPEDGTESLKIELQ